jgi:DNA-directed RNA polymerase sigma subunit (sigma70/sigma32)
MSLAELPDIDLVRAIKNENSSDAIVALQDRHSGLVAKICQKYSSASNASGVSVHDLLDNTPYLVYEAAKKFDENRGVQFNTFLGCETRYFCLNTINKENRYNNFFEDTALDFADSVPDILSFDRTAIYEKAEFVLNIIEQLNDDRAKTIIKERFFSEDSKNRSFSKIAERHGISTQGAIDIYNSAVKLIREKVKSENNPDII